MYYKYTAKEIAANPAYVAAALELMDPALREEVEALDVQSEEEFIEAYMSRHLEKYGEEFTI